MDWASCAANSHIITARTARGGHLGFYESVLPLGPTWADDVAVGFVAALLEAHAETNFMLRVNAVAAQTASAAEADAEKHGCKGGSGLSADRGDVVADEERGADDDSATELTDDEMAPPAAFPGIRVLPIARRRVVGKRPARPSATLTHKQQPAGEIRGSVAQGAYEPAPPLDAVRLLITPGKLARICSASDLPMFKGVLSAPGGALPGEVATV